MDNTYLKAAHEVVTGDRVTEMDGFMWLVTGVAHNGKRVTLDLDPMYGSITARHACKTTLRRSASVRVVAA